MKQLTVLLLVAISAGECLWSADPNWNPAAADRYSRRNGGTVLIVKRQGVAEFASYEPGYHPGTPSPVYSITKSLTALACLSLREPSLGDVVRTGRGNEPVTLRHLLSQTSGISPGYEKLYRRNIPDVRKAAAALSQEFPPGERFVYGPSHYESVGNILKPAGGRSDGARQALTAFLNRLDVHPVDWRTDRMGQIYLSAGVVLTPVDLLKIGEFILNHGRSHGFWTQALQAKWEPAFTGSWANPAYGLGFWLNHGAGNSRQLDIEEAINARLTREEWSRMSLSNAAPRDLVCMAGSGGQRVYIIPSLGAVIVRLGHASRFKDPAFLQALFSSRER